MGRTRSGIASDRSAFLSLRSVRAGEGLIYALIGLLITVGVILAQTAPDLLETTYLAEDGILEWLTVAVLLFCAALCLQRIVHLRSVRRPPFLLSLGLIAFGFIFVAGEEVSWGQRLFSIETPQWLAERNQQGELTIHNLMVRDLSVNRIVFGQILVVALALYLFVLPWLASRRSRVNGLVERLALPLPTPVQALAFIPALVLPELLVASPRADELMEACGVLMLLVLFSFPKNSHIYAPDHRLEDGRASRT